VKKIGILKLLFAALLLGTFSFTYVNDFLNLCEVERCGMNPENGYKNLEGTASNKPQKKNRKKCPCCVFEGDCCSDDSEISATPDLPKIITSPYRLKLKTFKALGIAVPSYFDRDVSLKANILINQYSLPPPKIPDIRVFIQSFLI
jgi:hypothetical protein